MEIVMTVKTIKGRIARLERALKLAHIELVEALRKDGQFIEQLEISVRTEKVLAKEGITLLDQLVALTERQVLAIPNMGRKQFEDVCSALKKIDCSLRKE